MRVAAFRTFLKKYDKRIKVEVNQIPGNKVYRILLPNYKHIRTVCNKLEEKNEYKITKVEKLSKELIKLSNGWKVIIYAQCYTKKEKDAIISKKANNL